MDTINYICCHCHGMGTDVVKRPDLGAGVALHADCPADRWVARVAFDKGFADGKRDAQEGKQLVRVDGPSWYVDGYSQGYAAAGGKP